MLQGLPELMVAPGAAPPISASARATVGSKTDDEPSKPRHASRRHGGSQPTPRCVGRRTEDAARVAIDASRAFVMFFARKAGSGVGLLKDGSGAGCVQTSPSCRGRHGEITIFSNSLTPQARRRPVTLDPTLNPSESGVQLLEECPGLCPVQ